MPSMTRRILTMGCRPSPSASVINSAVIDCCPSVKLEGYDFNIPSVS